MYAGMMANARAVSCSSILAVLLKEGTLVWSDELRNIPKISERKSLIQAPDCSTQAVLVSRDSSYLVFTTRSDIAEHQGRVFEGFDVLLVSRERHQHSKSFHSDPRCAFQYRCGIDILYMASQRPCT
jgi:hypothetical protein